MRRYYAIIAITFLINVVAFTTGTKGDHTKFSPIVSSDNSLSRKSIHRDISSSTRRFLRTNKRIDGNTIDGNDSTDFDSYDEVGIENRALFGVSGLKNVVSIVKMKMTNKIPASKLRNWLEKDKSSDFVKKALGLDKLSAAKAKLNPKAESGRSIDDVKTALAIEKLSGDALKSNPSFKYYDGFMSKSTKEWAKAGYSMDDAKKVLGLETLSPNALKLSENYKYYDEFMSSSVLQWLGEGKTIDDVKKLLGLENLSVAALKQSSNTKYFHTYMTKRVEGWLRSGKSLDEVKKMLQFDRMSAEAIKASPNLKYYNQFLDGRVNNIVTKAEFVPRTAVTFDEYMAQKITRWVKAGVTVDQAKKKLGLNKLSGNALKANDNYKYYQKFMSMREVN